MKAENIPSTYRFAEGDKVDRNTVLQFVGRDKWESLVYLCRCDCGELTLKTSIQLRSGRSRSCGCLSAEVSSVANRTHGMRKAPEYKSWVSMKQRCLNPRNDRYADYGGRGIKICERWLSFANFFADLGPRPNRSYTHERNNNELGYAPENCRWATKKEQSRNRRSSVILSAFGQTKHLADWKSDPQLACRPDAFEKRLATGWSLERAFTTPTRRRIAS